MKFFYGSNNPIVCFMRYTALTIVLLTTTIQLSFSYRIDAQEILKRKVSLSINNENLKSIIKQINQQTQVDFVYSSKTDLEKVHVSIKVRDTELADVLSKILPPNITYEVVANKIIIKSALSGLINNNSTLYLATSSNNQLAIQTAVRGQVTDETGPLPGVSIKVKGSSVGAVTDAAGRYSINVADNNAVLVFSFIGYITQEVPAGGRTSIDVVLASEAKSLNAVVVTALGIKKEAKSLGYATGTVNMDQITENRTSNVGSSLVGKVSGVNVSSLSSGPGGSSKIRIRGQSSFGGDNSPLIVVNGVPINNVSIQNSSRSDGGDGLQSIDPDDIESMTVLKGAAAAALYGFRAKDGAIIITTKTGGKSTGIGVDYNSNFQMENALDFTDFQYEYGQGEYGKRPTTMAEAQSSGTWSFGEKLDGAPTVQADGSTKPYSPNYNRVKDFYRTGANVTNSLAFSAGNANGAFRLSFTNTDASSIMQNSGFHRKIVNLGLNYNFTPKLTVQLNVNYSNELNDNPSKVFGAGSSANEVIFAVANSIPLDVLKNYQNPDGTELRISRFTSKTNPYWTINKHFENSTRDRLFGNAQVRYKFTDWLALQGRIGQDYFTRPYQSNLPTGQANAGTVTSGYNGRYEQYESTFRELNLDFLLTANKTFGDFGINFTMGGNKMTQKNTNIGTAVRNFYVKDLYTIGNGQILSPSYTFSEKKVNSLYGSVDLSFWNYLYLNLTARNDWFSTLNPKSNSYLYPSASTSFVFSDALSTQPSWLNYGKVRVAYAEVGGDTQPYQNALYYSLNPSTLNNSALGDITSTVSPNANLRPLKVKETEAGLELKMFDSRVNLDLSVYNKNTVDEILNVDISQSSGYSQTKVNIGKLRNRGVEALLSFTPVENAFRWETAVNGAYNKSKVLQLANNQLRFDVGTAPDATLGTVAHEVGKSLGSLRVYDYKRDDQGRPIVSSGLPLQGNIITAGSAIPKWTGAWLNTFTYKGLKVFTQIDFKAGAKMMSASNYNEMRFGLSKTTLVGREGGVVFDGVNADGTPNTTAVPTEQFFTNYSDGLIGIINIYNSSFIRWRTVSMSYDISRFVKKTFIKKVTLGLSCNNVLMIKKFIPNIDPEAMSVASDNNAGMEFYPLPTTRSFGLNLNVSL